MEVGGEYDVFDGGGHARWSLICTTALCHGWFGRYSNEVCSYVCTQNKVCIVSNHIGKAWFQPHILRHQPSLEALATLPRQVVGGSVGRVEPSTASLLIITADHHD